MRTKQQRPGLPVNGGGLALVEAINHVDDMFVLDTNGGQDGHAMGVSSGRAYQCMHTSYNLHAMIIRMTRC